MQRVSYIIPLYQSRKYKKYKDFRNMKNQKITLNILAGETRLGHMVDRCVYYV